LQQWLANLPLQRFSPRLERYFKQISEGNFARSARVIRGGIKSMKLRHAAAGLAFCAAFAGPSWARAQGKAALTTAQIDHLIRAEWNKESIVPAPAVDDARYLRRVYLDIVGVIPSEQDVRAFLSDTGSDKRARAVAALLDSPKYADNWTTYWDALLMGRGRTDNQQVVDRTAFRQWLKGEFQQNAHWNKFVYDLVSATGVNSEGGSYAKAMGIPANPVNAMAMARRRSKKATGASGERVFGTAAVPDGSNNLSNAGSAGKLTDGKMQADGAMMADGAMTGGGAAARIVSLPAPVNGATNWILKYQGKPQDLSGTASKLFLGVQIQCAQCHDHKTEKWKQEDFRRFTACFVNARPRPVDPTLTRDMLKGVIRQVNLEEAVRPVVRRNPGAKRPNGNAEYANSLPATLDGTDLADVANRRASLAAWMTAPGNPWFAKAIVNRLWNHFLGRGFIEPIDDIRPSNPVVAPELLDALSADFIVHDYDLKYLIKQICATQVYQLSAAPAKKSDPDNKFWARYRLKPMTPEELMDSVVTATNMGPVLERVAGARLDQVKYAMSRQFTFLFDVDEEFEQKDFEGTIPQALMLLNGNLVNRGATPIPGTTLADVLNMPGEDRDKITALYLRTLSRPPTASELAHWTDFVRAPRYLSTDTEANAPDPDPAGSAPAGRVGRVGRFANRNAANRSLAGVNNGGPIASGNSVNTVAPATPADRKALALAMRKKGGNNGIDPLARLAPAASAISRNPETQAYEDMFWALLNSSEFTFKH
jgi:Protein of unknown function (DUF1553)/Protein of unknown function (DUF1549)